MASKATMPDLARSSSSAVNNKNDSNASKQQQEKELRAREYQNELLQRVLTQNLVVALGTGTGKTYIAVMLLKEYGDKLISENKRAIFAVPSVPLVYQQAKYIKQHTEFEVGRYCSETGVDRWDPAKWEENVNKHHVLVMVYEIFRCALERGYIRADQIALLIVDECHHARKESPIRFALHELKRQVKNSGADVRVLGLTASVINISIKPQNTGMQSILDADDKSIENDLLLDPIEKCIQELEDIMLDARVAQPDDLAAVDAYGALPEIRTWPYKIHIVDEALKNVLGRRGRDLLACFAPPLNAEQSYILRRFERMQQSFELFLLNIAGDSPDKQKNDGPKELQKTLKRKLNQVLETYKELGVLALHNAIYMMTEWLSYTHLTGVPPEIVSPLTHSFLIELLTLQRSIKLLYNIQSKSTELVADDIPKVMSSAVVEMLDLLARNLESLRSEHHKPLCAIVFVTRRYAAWALHSLINSAARVPNSRYAQLRSTFLVGQGGLTESNTANEFMLTFSDATESEPPLAQAEDDKIFKQHVLHATDDLHHRSSGGQKELERFRRGRVNVLVATSVVEEGLDVPQCNLIIRFNIPNNYRGFIQSKGRARAKNALYYVMTPQIVDSLAQQKLDSFRRIYDGIVRQCVDRYRKNLPKTLTDSIFDAVEHDKRLFPLKPFRNRCAVLNMGNAISTLYEYCATLKSESGVTLYPHAMFGKQNIAPDEFELKFGEWGKAVVEEQERIAKYSGAGDNPGRSMVRCTICMPLNSPLRESIVGEWMPNKSSAKQAACQLACEKLYASHKELDEHFKPKRRDLWKPDLLADLGMEAAEVDARDGQTAEERKENDREERLFEKRIAKVFMPLRRNLSKAVEPLFLYAIEILLINELSSGLGTGASEEAAFRPENSKSLFGFYTRARLPTMADFSVFDRDGEMRVAVEMVEFYQFDGLDEPKKILIQNFHKYFFDVACRYDALQKAVEFDDKEVSRKQYWIVPLLRRTTSMKRHQVDWETLRHTYQHAEKSCACFSPAENWTDFADAVVRPTYRLQIDRRMTHYIVTSVRFDLTPLSKFPKSEKKKFSDYVDYFQQQYQAKISNLEQPLLQCIPSPSRLNRLNFDRDTRKEVNAIHFVPELIEREPIRGELWRQAIMLPSALHRIEVFLVADEVRREWHQRTNIGNAEKLSDETKWTEISPYVPPERATTNLQPICVEEVDDDIIILEEKVKNFSAVVSPSNINKPEKIAPLSKIGQLQRQHIDRFDGDDPGQIYFNMDIYDAKLATYMKMYKMGANVIAQQATKRDHNGAALCSPPPLSPRSPIFTPSNGETSSARTVPKFDLNAIEILSSSITFDSNFHSLSKPVGLQRIQGPEPSLILQALTSAKAADQFDFERCEMLGDCALKLFTTWFLYCRYRDFQEDKMTFAKKILISNAFLCVLAEKNGLCGAILAQRLEPPHNWLPPYYKPAAERPKPTLHVSPSASLNALHKVLIKPAPVEQSFTAESMLSQKMRLKTIADCVEALIGAYLLSCGPFGAQIFMHAFGMHVFPFAFHNDTPTSNIKSRWSVEEILKECGAAGFSRLFQPSTTAIMPVADLSDAQQQVMLKKLLCGSEQLEKTIGYAFKDKSFLLQALTHPAYTQNRVTGCYQRLEFLGDALIDYVITQYIFRKRLDADPGDLSDMRSALTNNTLFATIIVQKRLHVHLKHCDGKLHTKIRNFVSWVTGDDGGSDAFRLTLIEQYFNKFNRVVKNDAVRQPSEAETKSIRIVLPKNVKVVDELEDVEAPKALGDLMESVAGAIYLDSGQSLQAVWNFVCRMMYREIKAFTTNKPPKNHKRELYELLPLGVCEIGSESKPDGRIQHVLMLNDEQIAFRGVGASKNVAANAAAKCALLYLQKKRANAAATNHLGNKVGRV